MKNARLSRLLPLLLSLAACAGQPMHPPADVVSTAQRIDATDRKIWRRPSRREEFQLGAYRVVEIRRKGVESSGYSFFGWGTRKLGTTFTYALTIPSGRIDALCEVEQKGSQTAYEGKLGCKCGDAQLVTDVGRKAQVGTLTLAGQTYTVKPIREREGGSESDDPLGYRVDAASAAPLAAVDIVEPGHVWLRKELDEPARQQLSCLLSGVMLFRPIAHSERRTN